MVLLNRRGQSTAEYVICLSVVIGAWVAMQVYVKRGIQGRIKGVTDTADGLLLDQGLTRAELPLQYEPYYNAAGTVNTDTDNSMNEAMSAGGLIARTAINDSTVRTGSSTQGADLAVDDAWQ